MISSEHTHTLRVSKLGERGVCFEGSGRPMNLGMKLVGDTIKEGIFSAKKTKKNIWRVIIHRLFTVRMYF